ncbi:MAG: MlaD family protein [Candidatus Omnitrophica bacterium]|nr:MlaD family protein [Candidatus Omnitrophota bacterium]
MKTKLLNIQFKVGLFIFLGLIIFFVFVFSQGKILRGKGYEIKVVYNYIAGLDPGAPVRVSGYRVGEVKNITLSIEQDSPQIIVTIVVKPDVKLGRHSRFLVRNYGIIGEKYLEIFPTGLKDVPLIQPGETVKGEDPLPMERFLSAGEDILKNLNTLLVSLNKITGDENLKKELKKVVGSANDTLLKASETLDNFNFLASSWIKTSTQINETIAEIKPDLIQILSNVKGSCGELNQILNANSEKINNILSNLEKTSSDIEKSLPEITKGVKSLSESFVKTGERIGGFVEKIETQGLIADLISDTEIAKDVKNTIDLLRQASENMNIAFIKLGYVSEQIQTVVSNIMAGKGTIGKLVARDELYNQVFDMVQDLKAHPWKILFRGRGN